VRERIAMKSKDRVVGATRWRFTDFIADRAGR